MPKLSKPKSFSVSNETIEVDFKGTICECANLLKSGIVNQTIVLVAHADNWHEVNCLNLGADNSDLQSFKQFVEVMKLSLVDLGIISEEIKTDYDLKHEDFIGLEKEFPGHNYIDISKLNDYEKTQGGYSGKWGLRVTLNAICRDNLSIEEWITTCKERLTNSQKQNKMEKETLINKFKEAGNEKIVPERNTFDDSVEIVTELEITEGNQLGIPVEKIEVVGAEVISKPEQITVQVGFEKPSKKPISLQVFETLTPERISELQGLKERQEELVKQNPVIKITDKKTYEAAKKTKAILLKASTTIDGSTGIEATATKYLNTFKNMLKDALGPIAKITRDKYNEQTEIVSAWENAEILREQAEQRAKLVKIKKRTDELFAVPFTFNGSVYSIGTVYCLPSQIESATDEDFKIIVENGKAIKTALDAQSLIENEKDKQIEKLKAQLAALGVVSEMSNTEPEIVVINKPSGVGPTESPANKVVEQPIDNPNIPTPSQANVQQNTAPVYAPNTGYTMPPQENVLLSRLDLEHLEHIEKPAYLKCRGYYARALKDVGVLISEIMSNPDVTIKKAPKIVELAEILKKSV